MTREPLSVVIADAGPLIALAKIDRLALLHALYGGATVTQTVWSEATSGGAFTDASRIAAALADGWLTLAPDAPLSGPPHPALAAIDPGERSALHLGLSMRQQSHSVLMVLDDSAARAASRALALPLVGTLGILLRSHQRGLLARLEPETSALLKAGYYLSEALVRDVLSRAGELADT